RMESHVPYLDIEEGRILLGTEDVGVARAAAWPRAQDRELDRIGGIIFDEIGQPCPLNAEDGTDRLRCDGAGTLHPVIGLPLAEDDVEGDLVGPGILATDRLGEVG